LDFGRFALDIRRQFNSAIIAPRNRGQDDELRIGESRDRDSSEGLARLMSEQSRADLFLHSPENFESRLDLRDAVRFSALKI
jgi:hypothetical protein